MSQQYADHTQCTLSYPFIALATPVSTLVLSNSHTAATTLTMVKYTSFTADDGLVGEVGGDGLLTAADDDTDAGMKSVSPAEISEPTAESLAAK